MKKLVVILFAFVGLNVHAGIINIALSNSNLAKGEAVEVTLLASDFEAFDVFDMDLDFDTSLFSFDAASLESDLLASSPLIFEVDQVNGHGIALSFADFFAFEENDFVLAKFRLDAISEGMTTFSMSDVLFNNSLVGDLVVDSSATATASVAAPASLSLFAFAMIFGAGVRRKML